MNKRGQVTLFVILGLVMLIIVGLVLFFMNIKAEQPPIDQLYVDDHDATLQPIVDDIRSCIHDLTKEALIESGLKGGYINVQNVIYDLYPEHLNTGVEFFPESNDVIPYWYYVSGNTRGEAELEINIPPLDTNAPNSIKTQVENYVNENMLECMFNFRQHQEYIDVLYGEPKSNVVFRDRDVFVGLEWDINVTFEDQSKGNVKRFSNTINLDYKKTYQLAKEMLYELQVYSDVSFYESFALTVLEHVSLGGKNAIIPPIQGPTEILKSTPSIWFMDDVKEILKQEIAENSAYLQVMGSMDSFVPMTNDPQKNSIYGSMVTNIITDTEKLYSTRIRSEYLPMWPMYIKIKPGFGPIIMPRKPVTDIKIPGIIHIAPTEYNFKYDLTFPMLITLEDPFAFNGEGFIFRYAIEVNLRDNYPYEINVSELEVEYEEDEEPSNYGFGDQRTATINAIILNGYTSAPLEGFSLAYTCMDTQIPLGISRLKEGNAKIETMITPCLGGFFNGFEENMYMEEIYLDIESEKDYDVQIKVYPEQEINIQAKKRMFYPTERTEVNRDTPTEDIHIDIDRKWDIVLGEQAISNLIENEEVMLMFSIEEREYYKMLTLNTTNPQGKISLLPGTYEVHLVSNLMMGEGRAPEIILKERTYKISQGPLRDLFEGKEEVTINETTFNTSLLLGYQEINPFVITPEELMTNKYLTFYYASYNPDDIAIIQDLVVLDNVTNVPEEHKEFFTPIFTMY